MWGKGHLEEEVGSPCGSQVTQEERFQLTIRTIFIIELPSNQMGFPRCSDLSITRYNQAAPKNPCHGGGGEGFPHQLEVKLDDF